MSNILKAPLTTSQYYKRNLNKLIKIIPSKYHEINPKGKISVFGVNPTCVHIVSYLILNFTQVEIYVFDESELNLDIHIMDLQYFKLINSSLSLHCSTDIEKTANSDICIVCLMDNRNESINFFDDILINIQLYQKYIPQIVKYSPDTIIIVATYPFSVMSYYCAKFSKLPENRVLGVGASLTTKEFREILAQYFDVSVQDIYGWVSTSFTLNHLNILEPHSRLLWSTVMVGGVNIENIVDLSFRENNNYLFKRIIKRKRDVFMDFKVNQALGSICYEVCRSILTDRQIAVSLSCNIKGYFGIQYTSFLGLPCIIGRNGCIEIVKMILSDKDIDTIRHAAYCNLQISKLFDEKLKI